MTIPEQKRVLRQEVLARLRQVSPEDRATASARVCERLKENPIWRKAQCVLLFASRWDELDIWPLLAEGLAEGKTAALPQYVRARDDYQACRVVSPDVDVVIGNYGIREPRKGAEIIPPNRLDFVLVPGLGFSFDGYRLGRGKGYYDRFLARTSAVKCGVAFDWQLGLPIPAENHDVQLNCIITPSSWREFRPQQDTVGK